MYKVRFHLGAGKHYKHWQIRSENSVSYYTPAEVQLALEGCVLKRNKRKAGKVYASQVRDVCGWVECEKVSVEQMTFIYEPVSVEGLARITYDPKINPYWKVEGDSDNYDMLRVQNVVSNGNKLYINKEYRSWNCMTQELNNSY